MFRSTGPDDEREDPQMGALLGRLDPGRDDTTFWMRFHRSVVANAAFELARRRREAELTVVGVVSSWSRALLPLAMAAAAAAGIMLARPGDRGVETHLLVEEVLSMGLGDPIPASHDEEEVPGGILLASEIY
ncbi:MAG TPA: hypothetical protein VLA43_16685 [Longimicrobiales bacterium]|nr:hypothetical protein [Longimicrobiales bacterium]